MAFRSDFFFFSLVLALGNRMTDLQRLRVGDCNSGPDALDPARVHVQVTLYPYLVVCSLNYHWTMSTRPSQIGLHPAQCRFPQMSWLGLQPNASSEQSLKIHQLQVRIPKALG